MNLLQEIAQAESRIRPQIRETYLEASPFFSEMTGAAVHFKLENLQFTGSFKARGAMNKVLSLSDDERRRGVVTASTGNHGAGVAFSLRPHAVKGLVFVPEVASEGKLQAIRQLGAEIRRHGQDNAETETHARNYAAEQGMTYISPYNDLQVIAGQGTIGLELERQAKDIDTVLVALGGGGLISGIGCYLKSIKPEVRILGCSPENSQVMIQSVKAGKILDLPSLPTLSDGTAGGVEPGAITFDFCRRYVDDYVTVTETEIAEALRLFLDAQHLLIEGAAAVTVASLLRLKSQLAGQTVVAIICGANIDKKTLASVLR